MRVNTEVAAEYLSPLRVCVCVCVCVCLCVRVFVCVQLRQDSEAALKDKDEEIKQLQVEDTRDVESPAARK